MSFSKFSNKIQAFSVSTWVLIKEVIGKRPNSDLAELLHDVFLSPKIVLQYLVCIFSYDVLSS
jgi:hypothetical protein